MYFFKTFIDHASAFAFKRNPKCQENILTIAYGIVEMASLVVLYMYIRISLTGLAPPIQNLSSDSTRSVRVGFVLPLFRIEAAKADPSYFLLSEMSSSF